MWDSELVVLSPETFQAPVLIERAGPSTKKKFFEFFTVPIRNAHTRAAYYRAIQQFLAWAERAGYEQLEDIEPILPLTVSDPNWLRRAEDWLERSEGKGGSL